MAIAVGHLSPQRDIQSQLPLLMQQTWGILHLTSCVSHPAPPPSQLSQLHQLHRMTTVFFNNQLRSFPTG